MNTLEEIYQVFLEQMGEEEFLTPYRDACQFIYQKMEEINLEHSKKLKRTFIAQITYRVKTPQSCMEKLIRKKCMVDRETAQNRLGDIAGVRVICNFLDDIYALAEMLAKDEELEVVKIKDYVKKPKASGYQSLHVIVMAPTPDGSRKKVEIQIRTQAMNFWAVVEHHFVYKSDECGLYKNGKNEFKKDLKECARAIYKIDKKMLLIREKMEVVQSVPAFCAQDVKNQHKM